MSRNDLAYRSGNRLVSAGIGLSAIANLLGADASEHHMNSSDLNGLCHAVSALADLVKRDGYDLCEAFEPELELEPQPEQRAVEDLNAALSNAADNPVAQRKRHRTTTEG